MNQRRHRREEIKTSRKIMKRVVVGEKGVQDFQRIIEGTEEERKLVISRVAHLERKRKKGES